MSAELDLLRMVRKQQGTLDAVRAIVAKFLADIDGMETVDQTGSLADRAMSDIDDVLTEAGDAS